MAEPKAYITAGLPALDSAGSLPTDDITRAYITAGLPANDYEAAGGENKTTKWGRPAAIMRGMNCGMWAETDYLKPIGGV